MNSNLTELIFVLDRSGSMFPLEKDTIGGFNSLIEKRKRENDGKVYVTTVLFDDMYELLHEHVSINEVPPLTKKEYYARGETVLLDAVGKTIMQVSGRLSSVEEAERPGKILFVIMTDGYENASVEYTKEAVKAMITLQQEANGWKFLFLGADMDAVGEADSIGIRSIGACMSSATSRGIKSSFRAVSRITDFVKTAEATGIEFDEDFYDECEEAFYEVE